MVRRVCESEETWTLEFGSFFTLQEEEGFTVDRVSGIRRREMKEDGPLR